MRGGLNSSYPETAERNRESGVEEEEVRKCKEETGEGIDPL